ncbi:MAG: trypsin-like peptidase domain-containing protein, partial [Clostridiales bacterium]
TNDNKTEVKDSLQTNNNEDQINDSLKVTTNEVSKSFKKNSTLKYVLTIIITSFLTSIIIGGSLYYLFSRNINNQIDILDNTSIFQDQKSSEKATQNISDSTLKDSSTVTKISKAVGPSIVGIKITSSINNSESFDFGEFGDFGDFEIPSQDAEGSGIIISKDGFIITNYHVVEAADTTNSDNNKTIMEVYQSDNKEVKAKFIGGDSDTDLAVIKIEEKNLPVAKLGNSSDLQVGDLAIAIGNPLGLEFAGSVTTGVISALNRSISTDISSQNLIQTDAAINPGNSGGALLNSNGDVVGINSIKIKQAGIEGLGFAIPIDEAKPIVEQLIKYGKVKDRPMIGITGQDVSEAIAKAYDMHVGVYVTGISKNSGADKANIKKGDIIIGLAGKKIETMEDINLIKKNYKAGDTVEFKIIRKDKELKLKLTFTEES